MYRYLVRHMLVVNVLLMFCCHFSMKGNNVNSVHDVIYRLRIIQIYREHEQYYKTKC